MKIAVLSVGSFESQYSDYHLMRDIVHGFLQSGLTVHLYQKQYTSEPQYPDVLMPYIRNGSLVISNFPFAVKDHMDLKARYFADIRYYLEVCKKMKAERFDGIFLQSNNTAFLPIFYAKKVLRTPVLYNEQDIFPENARLAGIISSKNTVYRIASLLQKYAYRNADMIVTISEDMKQTICKKYGIPEKRVYVIYNWGHEEQEIPIGKNNRFLEEQPKEYGEFRVMYAGNLGRMQNVEYILEAAKLLKSQPNIQFYIVGSGSNEENLKEYAKENNLENVVFLPMQPPELVTDLYASADINVIPLKERLIFAAMPSKTADCLRVGKPVIACFDKNSNMTKCFQQHNIPVADLTRPQDLADKILWIRQHGWCGRPFELGEKLLTKENNVKIYCSIMRKCTGAK